MSSSGGPRRRNSRVDSPGGFGSGVMVGPRHLLTVSHIVQWLPNNQAGWIRFRPAFFDGSAPFGEAWATWTYYKYKVSGPTIDWIEGMYDYVCVVLNWPIGNLTGRIGSRGRGYICRPGWRCKKRSSTTCARQCTSSWREHRCLRC